MKRASIVVRIIIALVAAILLSCGSAPLPTPPPTQPPPTELPPTKTPSPTATPAPTATATPLPLAQWLQEGDTLFRQSRFQEAEQAYQRVITAAPDHAPAYVALGRLYWWLLGRHDDGLQAAQKAVDLAPDSPLAHAALARAYVDLRQVEPALAAAKRAAELGATDPEVQAILSAVYLQNRDYDPALEAAERAISLAPERADACAALGDAYYARADFARALAAYEKAVALEPSFARWHVRLAHAWQALARHAKVDESLQKALALAPDYGLALTSLARLRIEQNRFDDAQALLDKAVALAPDASSPYINQGYLHLSQEKPEEAMVAFRRALEHRPKDPEAQLGVAEAFSAQQECDSAAREAQLVEQWYPRSADGLIGQGYAKLCAEDPAKALDYFRRALKLEPYSASAHLGMGQAYVLQERWEDALASHTESLRLGPGHSGTHTAFAWAFGLQGQFGAQQSELDTTLRLDPDYAPVYLGLATLALQKGEYEAAEAHIRQTLLRRPQDALSRRVLGMALYEQNKAEEATEVLEQLIKDEPEEGMAHLYLGLAYRDAGLYAEAAKELKAHKGIAGIGKTEGIDGLIEWLDQGYKIAEKQFIQGFQQGLRSYLERPVKVRVDKSDTGGRTLVVILQATGKETEEDVFTDVAAALLGMSALAPRLDPPLTEGITVLVQKSGRTLYTAKLGMKDAIALGDGRRSPTALGALVEFSRPLGTQPGASLRKIRSDTEQTRELKGSQDVPFAAIDAETLRTNMRAELAETDSQETIAEDQALLTLLGIIEPDTNLRQLYEDLYAEQVAGYYDTDQAAMFVVQGKEQSAQDQVVVAHEYTHALQDQTFGLEENDHPKMNADERLAFKALVEGDATLTMIVYAGEHIPAIDLLTSITEASGLEQEKLDQVPELIQEQSLFPYASGLVFVSALYQQGGWDAVNAAYAPGAFPRSTEQILHPERYRRGDAPAILALPDIAHALGQDWQLMDANVMGELGLRLALADDLGMGAAMRAAEGWGADQYALLERGSGEAHALAIRTTWDDQDEAQEFWNLFQTAMMHRPEYTERVDQLVGPVEVRQWVANGSYVIAKWLHGQVVLIYAEEEATATTILGAFGG